MNEEPKLQDPNSLAETTDQSPHPPASGEKAEAVEPSDADVPKTPDLSPAPSQSPPRAGEEAEIDALKERNKKVEQDKAWELSWTRRLFIAAVTYLSAGIWLAWINDSTPWLKALVPAGAYLFSTFSLPFIKKWWLKK